MGLGPIPLPRGSQPCSSSLELPLCSQDTTDYVAYVAKDPINQRGDAGLEALWMRRDALGAG